MSKDSQELRAEIARTRGVVSEDVDAIVDRVSPSNVAHRQTEKFMGTMNRAKEAVMGRSESINDQRHEAMDHAGERIHDAPHRIAEQTKGSPLAAGLIAFGAGLLASSLLPATEREGELVQTLKDKAEPLTSELSDAASQMTEDLKQPVQDAVEDLKQSAQESVERVKHEATSEAEGFRDHAKDASQDFKDKQN